MYKSIGMPEFYQKAKREQLPIIDVREKDEYAHGYVPGARNIPLSNLGNDYPQLNQDKHYYLICQTGSRSAMAAQFLASQGYDVTNVMGGTGSWLDTLE